MPRHISSITPRSFKELYAKGNLQEFSIDCMEGTDRDWGVRMKLKLLYEELLYPKGNGLEEDHKVMVENIRAIVLYGSSLFNHFPPKTKSRKRWIFCGPNIIKIKDKGPPNDVDFMILLKNKLKNMNEDIILPKIHKTGHGYGSYDVRIDSSIELLKGSNPKGLKLHIAYRTEKQFIKGINNGDYIAEWVYKYGVPFIGKDAFLNMIKNITGIERQPLHNICWSYDESKNKVSGYLTDYVKKEIIARKTKFELIDI